MAPSRLRPLASAFGGVLVALAVLGLLELGLRAVGIPDPGLYAGDPSHLWWLRPGLDREVPGPESGTSFRVRTNELGLRGSPPPSEGPWTLALGCSTTFGWGVDEHQAWPAVLADLLGQPVINGGQPGWSTHQALAVSERWLELGPTRVILGFIVRDAQPASRPDHLARPSSWLWRSQLGRGLQALLLRSAGPARPSTGGPRVSPEHFEENLSGLVALAGDTPVVLLAFPQIHPADEHIAAMARVGPPVVAPQLSRDLFFPSDPIHLTVAGHQALAQQLAEALP